MWLRVFLMCWALVIVARILYSTVGRWNQRRGRGL
jgi:hypothetical protein